MSIGAANNLIARALSGLGKLTGFARILWGVTMAVAGLLFSTLPAQAQSFNNYSQWNYTLSNWAYDSSATDWEGSNATGRQQFFADGSVGWTASNGVISSISADGYSGWGNTGNALLDVTFNNRRLVNGVFYADITVSWSLAGDSPTGNGCSYTLVANGSTTVGGGFLSCFATIPNVDMGTGSITAYEGTYSSGSGGYGTTYMLGLANGSPMPAPVITSGNSGGLTHNAFGSYQITADNSPTSYGASGLPPGMNVNGVTGAITGTPSSAGTFNATVTATNGAGTGSLPVTFSVAQAGQGIAWSEAPSSVTAGGTLGFSVNGSATGSYAWSVSPGGPTGISGNGSSQNVTFPSVGTFTISVYSNGNANYAQSNTLTANVTVGSSAPAVNSPASATLTYGSVGTYQITATNSPSSYGASGLPPGMSVNTATGLISGTPSSRAGSPYASNVSATNGGGTGNLGVSITINKASQTATWTQSPGSTSAGGSLTFSATGASTGVYNWSVSPAGPTGISGTGAAQTITFPSSGAFTVSVYAASDTNYNQSSTINASVSVTAAPPVVTSPAAVALTYGTAGNYQIVGTNTPTSYSATGLPPGMSINTGTGAITGTPTTTTGSPFTANVTATNGGGSGSLPVVFTVNKAQLTVTANNASRVFGAANPGFTPAYSGWKNGDTPAVLSGAPSLATAATSTSSVGSHTITTTVGTLTTTNYFFNLVNGTLTVTPAPLTVTASSPSKVYNGTNLAVGNPATSGLVAGDSLTGFTGTTSVGPGAGSFTTSVSSITTTRGASNYSISYVSGSATISKAALTVTANNASRLYGAPEPTFSASYSGWVNGETTAVLTGAPSLTTATTVASNVGVYPITAAAGTQGAANYSLSYFNGTLTISAAAQTVGLSPASATVVTGNSVIFTASGGQTGVYNWGGTAGATGAGTTKSVTFNTVGTFTVTVQAPSSGNYLASNVATASVTVNAAVAGYSGPGSSSLGTAYMGAAQATRDSAATSTTAVLTINNTGTGSLSVSATNISGANATDFSVIAINGSAVAYPLTIGVGGSGTITVRFAPAPSSATGNRSATLTITNNSTNRPSATVALSGTSVGGILVTAPGALRSLP